MIIYLLVYTLYTYRTTAGYEISDEMDIDESLSNELLLLVTIIV